MAVIYWTAAWRRSYHDLAETIKGAGYFAGQGLWILCGSPSVILTATDDDLRETPPVWTPRADGGGSVHNAISVNTVLGIAIVVGDSNWVNESTDGITWSGVQTSPATGENLSAVAGGYNSSGFPIPHETAVAVSSTPGGKIFDRGLGGLWANADTGAVADELHGVCYAPDLSGFDDWLAVGTDGTNALVATSLDPSSLWTRYSTVETAKLLSCARGNGLFMAGGLAGIVMTSPTGLTGTWTVRPTGGTDDIAAVNHLGGSYWIATGNTGSIYISPDDGVSWSVSAAVGSEAVGGAVSDTTERTTLIASTNSGWTSFDETQADHTPVDPPTSEVVLSENTEYAAQAITRLVQQFRG